MKMTVPASPDTQRWTANVLLRCRNFSKARCIGLLLCALAFFLLANRNCSADDDGPSKASKEISLKPFGYEGLSPMSRFTTQHDLTISFIDDSHLLLTYNPKKLIERHPGCPPSHKDHMIEAQVLDLSSGQVVRRATWYVHDEHGYLWPLGQGHFLLRILNSLYVLDSNLQQKLLLQSPAEILWTSVTPDGKQIILETTVDNHSAEKKDQRKDLAKAKVKIEFLDAESLAVQRTIKSNGVIPLEGTSSGFGDVLNSMSGKVWLVRFGASSRQRENITRVRSRCIPNLLFPTNTTMLIGRCSAAGSDDYNVSVFTLTGHFLWRQRWSQHRYERQFSEAKTAAVLRSAASPAYCSRVATTPLKSTGPRWSRKSTL